MPIRQPIASILGHVDTGKTLLLDKIRKTTVQAREAGGITQHIGASFFPYKTLKKLVGPLLSKINMEIKIPGLLVIDTPGHEAFTNLRKRGGSVSDIAILVIDILRGFEVQTLECIEILKARKTPFLVAANKIDRIPGWKQHPEVGFIKSYQMQDPYVRQYLDEKMYNVMGSFSRLKLNVDRFDKIRDFTKTIALVPTSAKTGEGVKELLMVLIGLTQQYMENKLHTTKGSAKGTILEVKDEPGLGLTLNTIIYDGILNKNDVIVVGGKEKPIVTRIRAILLPKPLDELRDPRDKFTIIKSISAAAGIKIVAPNLDNVLAGAPLYSVSKRDEIDKYTKLVSKELEKVRRVNEIGGVILKTDTLGSLEAIAHILDNNEIKIRIADVGDVSKREIIEASIVKEAEPVYGVVLAFNVKILPDAEIEAKDRGVKIFQEKIIYHLIEKYTAWNKEQRELKAEYEFNKLIKPGKLRIIEGCIFRKAKPAIIGVEVLAGKIKPKNTLVRAETFKEIGEIQQIQDKGKAVSEAEAGIQTAISMEKPIVGRHIFEKDVLYTKLPEAHVRSLVKKFLDKLTIEEKKTLDEYIKKMRKNDPFWAA